MTRSIINVASHTNNLDQMVSAAKEVGASNIFINCPLMFNYVPLSLAAEKETDVSISIGRNIDIESCGSVQVYPLNDNGLEDFMQVYNISNGSAKLLAEKDFVTVLSVATNISAKFKKAVEEGLRIRLTDPSGSVNARALGAEKARIARAFYSLKEIFVEMDLIGQQDDIMEVNLEDLSDDDYNRVAQKFYSSAVRESMLSSMKDVTGLTNSSATTTAKDFDTIMSLLGVVKNLSVHACAGICLVDDGVEDCDRDKVFPRDMTEDLFLVLNISSEEAADIEGTKSRLEAFSKINSKKAVNCSKEFAKKMASTMDSLGLNRVEAAPKTERAKDLASYVSIAGGAVDQFSDWLKESDSYYGTDERNGVVDGISPSSVVNIDFSMSSPRLNKDEDLVEIADAIDVLRGVLGTVLKQIRSERGEDFYSLVIERLKKELAVVEEVSKVRGSDWLSYYITIALPIEIYRQSGGLVGDGRGSGAGSLLAWLLGIVGKQMCPIDYGLLLERFLNPERVSMPDFDVDYANNTFVKNELTPKVLMILSRIRNDKDKMVAFFKDVYSGKVICYDPSAKDFDKDGQESTIDGYVERIRADKKQPVGRTSIIRKLPLGINPTDASQVVMHLSGKYGEEVGRIKFDFLGLKTLKVLDNIVRWSKDKRTEFDIDDLLNDPNSEASKVVFNMLANGMTDSVFQLGNHVTKDTFISIFKLLAAKGITSLSVIELVELISVVSSLIRPGPAKSGMKDAYIKRVAYEPDIALLTKKFKEYGREVYSVIRPESFDPKDDTVGSLMAALTEMLINKYNPDIPLEQKNIEDTFLVKKNRDSLRKEMLEQSKNRNDFNKLFGDVDEMLAIFDYMRTIYIYKTLSSTPEEFEQIKELLSSTNWCIVYQEQIMGLAKILSGYSLGGADLLRRAMGKKNIDEMREQKKTFIDGIVAKRTGDTEELERLASFLFGQIEEFAGYGFNKSHANAYSEISKKQLAKMAYNPLLAYAAILEVDFESGTAGKEKARDQLPVFNSNLRKLNLGVITPPSMSNLKNKFVANAQDVVYAPMLLAKSIAPACAAMVSVFGEDATDVELEDALFAVELSYKKKEGSGAAKKTTIASSPDTIVEDFNRLLGDRDINVVIEYENPKLKKNPRKSMSMADARSYLESQKTKMGVEELPGLRIIPDVRISPRIIDKSILAMCEAGVVLAHNVTYLNHVYLINSDFSKALVSWRAKKIEVIAEEMNAFVIKFILGSEADFSIDDETFPNYSSFEEENIGLVKNAISKKGEFIAKITRAELRKTSTKKPMLSLTLDISKSVDLGVSGSLRVNIFEDAFPAIAKYLGIPKIDTETVQTLRGSVLKGMLEPSGAWWNLTAVGAGDESVSLKRKSDYNRSKR